MDSLVIESEFTGGGSTWLSGVTTISVSTWLNAQLFRWPEYTFVCGILATAPETAVLAELRRQQIWERVQGESLTNKN